MKDRSQFHFSVNDSKYLLLLIFNLTRLLPDRFTMFSPICRAHYRQQIYCSARKIRSVATDANDESLIVTRKKVR